MHRCLLLPFLLGSLSLLGAGDALAVFPTLYLKPVVQDQFHAPTTITSANDGSGRVFVCDQPGRIYIIKDGMMLPTPFLDISHTAVNVAHRKVLGLTANYDERGLLGLAFHPGYANPLSQGYRKFYLNYNKTYQAGIDPPPPVADHTPNCTTVIAEFQVTATNADVADPLSERRLLLFSQPQSNHNGGGLVFGPDETLYIASGDGGSSNDNNAGHTGGTAATPRPTNGLGNSQDKTNYLGKILRINPHDPDGAGALTYSIPASNPFVGAGGGVKEEIFAFGIRNPWGFCFDNRPGGTGRFFSADVGQGRVEEVNIIVSGGNYGWRYLEGNEMPLFSSNAANAVPPNINMPHPGGTLISPIAQYAHPNANVTDPANPPNFLPQLGLSITGGFVYRGTAIPSMQGKYVFADYGATSGAASGRFMGLEETTPLSGVFTLTQTLPLIGPNPAPLRVLCLGEDDSGEIYVGGKITGGVQALQTGLPNGAIYKIVPAPPVVSTTTLDAVKDTSILAELGPSSEEQSNGQGHLMAGQTASANNRRALLQFDISSLPVGSTIVSASLQLSVNLVENATARNLNVFKLRESWGEAASLNPDPVGNPWGGAPALVNDATWDNRFYHDTTPTPWTVSTDMPYWFSSSALRSITTAATYTWTDALAGDVRSWLAAPSTNNGWILVGVENSTSSTKRIESRESLTPSARPKLIVTHVPPTPYETWRATYFLAAPTGAYIDPAGENDIRYDTNADGISDVTILTDRDGFPHQMEYAYGFSPFVVNAPGSDNFTTAIAPGAAGSTDLTITFRRDSSATDLTYQLQISGDLTNWTTVAQSTGGATAIGQNGGVVQSDNALSGNARVVTVLKNLAAGSNGKQFARLRVERTP
jgi:glucose/arabinose dehydrogenase